MKAFSFALVFAAAHAAGTFSETMMKTSNGNCDLAPGYDFGDDCGDVTDCKGVTCSEGHCKMSWP